MGPLSDKSNKLGGVALADGGGLLIRSPDPSVVIQYHPGGGVHGPGAYWKFSSPDTGILKAVAGTITGIAIAVIPGADQAVAGDYNGGARQFVYEVSPIGGGSIITSYFSWLYDWAVEDSQPQKGFKF